MAGSEAFSAARSAGSGQEDARSIQSASMAICSAVGRGRPLGGMVSGWSGGRLRRRIRRLPAEFPAIITRPLSLPRRAFSNRSSRRPPCGFCPPWQLWQYRLRRGRILASQSPGGGAGRPSTLSPAAPRSRAHRNPQVRIRDEQRPGADVMTASSTGKRGPE